MKAPVWPEFKIERVDVKEPFIQKGMIECVASTRIRLLDPVTKRYFFRPLILIQFVPKDKDLLAAMDNLYGRLIHWVYLASLDPKKDWRLHDGEDIEPLDEDQRPEDVVAQERFNLKYNFDAEEEG
jgi:hypothetical protein